MICLRKFLALWSIVALIFACTVSASAEGIWRLDGSNAEELPKNFRMIPNENISASGQPSLAGLKVLANNLRENFNGEIYILDLREEPHGFLNGYPVSWYVEKNLANFFRGSDEIEDDELERLDNVFAKKITLTPLGNADKALFESVNIFVTAVKTERQAATELRLNYERFGATDMLFPAPAVVDKFISFLFTVDKDAWLHFHCQAGNGRTTTFLVLHDILTNPEKSLEEICARQVELGGSDLLSHMDGDPHDYYVEAHNFRAEKIRQFYRYVHEGYLGQMTWSEFYQKEL